MDLMHVAQPVRLYHSVVNGSFAASGLTGDLSWLASGTSPDLTQFVYEHQVNGGRMISVNGGISGLGPPLSAIVLDEITLVEGQLGGACEREPHGTISARTAEGHWVDLVFDGVDPATWQATGPCDGIGRAYYRGVLLGEVELDASAVFDFQGAPW